MAVIEKFKNISIYAKVVGLVTTLSVLVILAFVHVRFIKEDVFVISSQREIALNTVQLSQQIGYYCELVVRDKKNSKDELEKVRNLYEKNLIVLKNGGELLSSAFKKRIPPASDELKPILRQIDNQWGDMSENITRIITLETFRRGNEIATGSIDRNGFYSEKDVFKPLNPEIKAAINAIETNLGDFSGKNTRLVEYLDNELAQTVTFKIITQFIYLLFALFVIVIFFVTLKVHVFNMFQVMKKSLTSIASGDIRTTIDTPRNDEVGECADALNTHIGNLNEIVSFIEKIGTGQLDAEYKPKSDDDILGKSLFLMKETMKKTAEEELLRKHEDEIRNWSTMGVAKFGELLRNNNDDIDELAFSLVSNIIEYVHATLGGLFILEEEQDTKYFRLAASYAYDRRKFIQKRIDWGEGLIGRSALESKTIHLTELPDDYLEITSGLGNSKPTSVVICPLRSNEVIFGILEIASFSKFEKHHIEFIEHISDSIGATISSVKINVRTSFLLKESREQAERLAQQEEEMRQNMEEMQATQEEFTLKNKEMDGIVSAIDNSSGTYELNADGKFIKVNENYLEYTGFKKEEIIDLNFKDLVKDNFKTANDVEYFWNKLLNGLSLSKNFEYKIKGKTIWLQESLSPIKDATGDINRIFVLVNDITDIKDKENEIKENVIKLQEQEEELNQNIEELRATQDELMRKDEIQREEIEELNVENNMKLQMIAMKEEQSRMILEACLDGVIKIDNHGVILFFNDAAQNIWGYKKEEVLGNKINMLMPDEHAENHDMYINNYLQSHIKKIIGIGREVPIVRKDGSSTVVNLSVIELILHGESIFTGFVKDLTQQIKQEEEKQVLLEKVMAKEFEYQAEIDKLRIQIENLSTQTPLDNRNVKLYANTDKTTQPVKHTDDQQPGKIIEWTEKIALGIQVIDDQHKGLVDIINLLYSAFKEGKAKKEIKQILKDLVSYTSYHFGTEEKYFKEYNYEFTNEHISEHRKLVDQVVDFQKQMEAGSVTLTYDVMTFLKEWLENHILLSDKKYVPWLQSNLNKPIQQDETLIVWNDSYKISINTIDDQHKNLVDLMNQLYNAFKDGRARKQVKNILKGLVDYTDYHFGFEERHFKEFKYPDADAHLKEHAGFVKKIKEFQKEFEAGTGNVSYELMHYLRNWLLQHIQGTDKNYVPLFKQKGVK